MKKIKLQTEKYIFIAKLEENKSPETCKWLLSKLPWDIEMVHVSWSGNACFAMIDEEAYSVPFENPIRIPSRGEIIVYPGNIANLQMGGEFFMSWGPCSIACQNGNLTGNHVLTIIEGIEQIEAFGQLVHFGGTQKMTVSLVDK